MLEIHEEIADEMFAELGYRKVVDNDEICVYDFRRNLEPKTIRFVKEHQRIDLYGNNVYTTIYLDELQAINQKCKELEWI